MKTAGTTLCVALGVCLAACAPRQTTVAVEATPAGARIFRDGQGLGRAPVMDRVDGRRWSSELEYWATWPDGKQSGSKWVQHDGGAHRLEFDAPPDPDPLGFLRVTASVAGTAVTIGGIERQLLIERAGEAGAVGQRLKPGTYEITATKRDHHRQVATVDVSVQEFSDLHFQMEKVVSAPAPPRAPPPPGTLVVSANVAGATVTTADGVSLGTIDAPGPAGAVQWELKAGSYALRATRAGYLPSRVNLEVGVGQSVRHTFERARSVGVPRPLFSDGYGADRRCGSSQV